MLTLHVTFVTVVLIFAKYLSLYLHIFTCTYRGTYTQAHMYNQHTRGITTAGHRDLDERGGKKTLLETSRTHIHTHKKIEKKLMEETDFHESKTKVSRI